MSDTFDELRFVTERLKPTECAIVDQAIDEFELLQRDYLLLQAQLIESNQMRIALNDQLIAMRKQAKWSYSSGWMQVTK